MGLAFYILIVTSAWTYTGPAIPASMCSVVKEALQEKLDKSHAVNAVVVCLPTMVSLPSKESAPSF